MTKEIKVEPLENWSQEWGNAILRIDATQEGRLVRLADILKWRMNFPTRKPYSDALAEFLEAIPEDIMDWLYKVGDGYAHRVDENHQFGYFTEDQLKKNVRKNLENASFNRIHRATGRQSNIPENLPDSNNSKAALPGVSSLKRLISESWIREKANDGQYIGDHQKLPANHLAISFDKAHRCWGWGVRIDPPEIGPDDGSNPSPDDLRKRAKGSDWTDAQETLLNKDFKEAKGTVASRQQTVGKLWGISASAVKKQISSAAKKAKKSAPMKAIAKTLVSNE